MALRREIKQYIESELRDYDNTKKEWETIQSNVIHGSSCGDESGIRGTDIGSPTESKALKLITNKRLAQLERTMKAFESVITRLNEDILRLVVLRYWTSPRTLTDDGIALQLCMSRRTFFRTVDGIVTALAKEMGIID